MGRANKQGWDLIKGYVVSDMDIANLHAALGAALGPAFEQDISFWNSVITDVTTEPNDPATALRKYETLRARHVVSISCSETFLCDAEKTHGSLVNEGSF